MSCDWRRPEVSIGKIKNQNPGLQLLTRLEEKKEKTIIFMINSYRYLLDYVFIVFEVFGYRLVMNRSGVIITDEMYETLKGAKIAFLKFHHLLSFYDDDRPIWSHAYVSDKGWLYEKLKKKT